MSLDTETALAGGWPIEPTESACIGDHVARLYARTVEDVLGLDQHFGVYLWVLTADERPMFSLLGTTWPGALYSYSPWAEDRVSERVHREFAQLYADAGFYMDPRNSDPRGDGQWHPPVPRPCVGDPRLDPTVLEEGYEIPWVTPVAPWFEGDLV
jgi:hypothetical protein